MRILTVNPKGSNFKFKLPIPALGSKLSGTQRFLEIITSFRILGFLAILFLLPFSSFFFEYRNSVSLDSSNFIFVVLALLFIASFYGVEVALSKEERVIDPKGSLVVLMFGLLVTAASALLIFTDFESSANTFGLVGESITFKGICGLSIITGMSVYYLTQMFGGLRKSFSSTFKVMSLGFVYYGLLSLLIEDYSVLLSTNLVAILFTFIGMFMFRNTVLKLMSVISFGIVFINFWQIEKLANSFVPFQISLLILSLIVSYLVFSFRFEDAEFYFASYFKNWRKVFKKNTSLNLRIHRALKQLTFPLYFALPILIVALAVQLLGNDTAKNLIDSYSSLYSAAFEQINTDFVSLLIGNGAGTVGYYGGPLLAQVIVANGLIGILAYFLIFVFGFVQAVKNIINSDNKGNKFIPNFAASIYVIFVPIMGIFVSELDPSSIRARQDYYLHYFFLMFIWWICLAVVAGIEKKNYLSFTVSKIRTAESAFGRNLIRIFALTLFLISYILIYTVLKNIGTLL